MTDLTETIAIDSGDGPPVTVTATLTRLERREEPGIYGRMIGLNACLTITAHTGSAPDRTDSYCLSRLVDETDWIIDAQFGPNGIPRHSNGFGARYLTVRTIAPELADLLDREAVRRGLAHTIGRNVRLVLPEDDASSDDEDEHDEDGARDRI